MRQNIARYTASLVADSDNDMLRRFAYRDFDRRWCYRHPFTPSFTFLTLYDPLEAVAQELADDVLEVREDVGERCIEMAA